MPLSRFFAFARLPETHSRNVIRRPYIAGVWYLQPELPAIRSTWSKTMSKRIVYCSDGTWQNAMSNTNVYRLYKAMLVTSDQVTFYDDGVGADLTGLSKILGGAIGAGLNQKIMDAYTSIA